MFLIIYRKKYIVYYIFMVRKISVISKKNKMKNSDKIILFLTLFLVFIFSVLEIINCDYLIKYIDNDESISISDSKKKYLVIKYCIIIFIIISFIFGGLLYYEKIRYVKLLNPIVSFLILIILFIAKFIIILFSIYISFANKYYYNYNIKNNKNKNKNKNIIIIQNVCLLFNFFLLISYFFLCPVIAVIIFEK